MIEELKDKKRELSKFIEIAEDLKNVLGDLDSEKKQQLERESWINKAITMAAIEIMTQRNPSKATIELMLALPQDDMKCVINILKKNQPHKLLGMPIEMEEQQK